MNVLLNADKKKGVRKASLVENPKTAKEKRKKLRATNG